MTDKPKTLQLKPRSTPAKPNPLRAPVRPKGPARARPQSEVQAERAARDAAWAAGKPAGADRPPRDDAPRGPAARPRSDAYRNDAPRGRAPARAEPSGQRPAPRPPRDARPDLARVGNVRGEVRLNKRMAELGLCSRREADEWIARGWVLVNGAPAVMGMPVAPDAQVEVLPQARHQQAGQVTILLHKPMGYVSGQPEDGHEAAATLIGAPSQWRGDARHPADGRRFAPEHTRGLAPCGRLDIDSVGLLVLTQDGRIARQLIGENSGIEKEYLVRVHHAPNGPHGAGVVTQNVQAVFPAEKLALLRHGLSLDEQPLKPAQVEWMNPEQLRFVLVEGKKRQIRRMCEQVGLHVVGLKRIRIGNVVLGNLPVGQWRYLGAGESFA
ncbi:MAG: pseudouridine synthase [Comamonadaceae bacterium]|nr:pseudouridine synthase [Comamonadaceae bacterium]